MSMQHRRQTLIQLGALGAGLTALGPTRVFAAVFMDMAQAQQVLLPLADQFDLINTALNDTMLNAISKASDQRIPKGFAPQCWVALRAGKRVGWFMTDRVIGKNDYIDYAVGFDNDTSVMGVEVLAYRENHGAEIRQSAWRRQFTGRKTPSQMRFNDEIRNISGATLSCQHVTEGVQRLSALAGLLSNAS